MIVVGVDGSRTGLEAAGWAAAEAALRGSPLTVAYAVPRWVSEESPVEHYAEVARWMRDGAHSVLIGAQDRARHEAPQVRVEGVLLPGDPRSALIKASEGASLLVVGSRGIGGVRGLLVGSVAHGVAAHARTDVVLVHEPPASPRGEIVAGTDGSPGSAQALEMAFTEAELRGARVRAVRAWAWPHAGGFEAASPESERDTVGALEESLAEHRKRHPGVQVMAEVVHGHPVEVLKDAAVRADLLVVGSRGHGQLAGMLIGSISQALLHRTPCPLAVVRG